MLPEFASYGAQVLGAAVEPVDLDVRGVGDQGNPARVAALGECRPASHCGLPGLLACVLEVELPVGAVVRDRALRFAGSEGCPAFALLGVAGAVDVSKLRGRRVRGEPVEHRSWTDGGQLLAVADRDQLRPG